MSKTNKQPPPLRRTFGDLVNNNLKFKAILERNGEALQALCRANDYLLSLQGKSVYRQLKELYLIYGYVFNRETYSSFKLGKKKSCSSLNEWLIASYWGLTPDELRSLDISKSCDHIKPVISV